MVILSLDELKPVCFVDQKDLMPVCFALYGSRRCSITHVDIYPDVCIYAADCMTARREVIKNGL